jgi:RimJ/RimL family protein N-acetyltransferase
MAMARSPLDDPQPLVGAAARLDPVVPDDAEPLFAALDDAAVWGAGFMGGPAARPPDVDGMRQLVEAALGEVKQGCRLAYTVRLVGESLGRAGTVVGTSSLGDIDVLNERVHLGWTAYDPRWWGTGLNAEVKLLLLGHCFDGCQMGRVQIQTDRINKRSQAAIARLGAVREGVLRRHVRRGDGTFRDTVVYSVVREEWPVVRSGLLTRLGRPEG